MTSAPANLPTVPDIIEQNQTMELLKATYRTELDVLMEQAKMYPRDMIKRLDEAKVIACSSTEIAEACFYKKPTGQKDENIEGPSIRLAEIIAMCWGNMMIDVRTQLITDSEVICRGMGMDCQTGFGVALETRIRIIDRNGNRYPDHLVTTTAMAGCSIAYRNIVFRLVPTALVQPVYLAVKDAAIGTGDKFETRKGEVIARLMDNLGISTARILLSVKAEEIEEINPSQLETLIGYGTAIHNGDVGTEEVFPPPGASASAELTNRLKQSAPSGKPSGEAKQTKGGQGPAPSASPEPSKAPEPVLATTAQTTKAKVTPDPAKNDPVTLADPPAEPPETAPEATPEAEAKAPDNLEETLNGALNGDGASGGKGPPVLDQMIDWFAQRAGGIKSHDAFTRLQDYAKQVYANKDINIQTMSDRAINAYWMHLKKVNHENVN